MHKHIGVFDSGIGGLTVLSEIVKLLPREDTIYLGDTARVPYGTKSAETVVRYSKEVAALLVNLGLKVLVVACNTASAYSLPELKSLHSLPIIGVIEPGAERAKKITRNGRIGVIGTDGTVRSGAYVDVLKRMDDALQVFSRPCPLFVPLAEEGWTDNEVAVMSARHYLEELKKKDIDTLILGCTHYPLLKGVIGKVMGDGVVLVDSAEETALKVKDCLLKKGELKDTGRGSRRYLVTDSTERFALVGKRFIGKSLGRIEKIDIAAV